MPPANKTSSSATWTRQRKRESDRRSQRQTRERKKSRLGELESLVELLQEEDQNKQAAAWAKRLNGLEAHNRAMVKCLADVRNALQIHDAGFSRDKLAGLLLAEPICETAKALQLPLTVGPSSQQAMGVDMDGLTQSGNQPCSPIARCDPRNQSSQYTKMCSFQQESRPLPYSPRWSNSPSSCSCRIETLLPIQSGQPIWRGNYWTYANEVVGKRLTWTNAIRPATDSCSDDTPVRALVEGWDAVAERGSLHPTWEILRSLDETLLSRYPMTERLAVLRLVHTRLQSYIEPTAERQARVPPWYRHHSNLEQKRSHAIDYCIWPGMRQKLTMHEHRYCGNEFWNLLCRNLRVLWPYRFSDCYMQDTKTMLYRVSPLFDQRLNDIKCWTVGQDMFSRFPELANDIPAFICRPQHLASSLGGGVRSSVTKPVSAILASARDKTTLHSTRQDVDGNEEGVKKHTHMDTLQVLGSNERGRSRPVLEAGSMTKTAATGRLGVMKHGEDRPDNWCSTSHAYAIEELSEDAALDALFSGIVTEAEYHSYSL